MIETVSRCKVIYDRMRYEVHFQTNRSSRWRIYGQYTSQEEAENKMHKILSRFVHALPGPYSH